jgi:magnesium transporter
VEVLTGIDPERIAELRARGEFFWLDLVDPAESDIMRFGELLGLHPLAVEDTLEFGQRPKLDDYAEYALLVFYGVHPDEEGPRLVEVHLFLHGDFVVTVHHEPCAALGDVRGRLESDTVHSEQFVVYRILDALTDSFFPALEGIDDEVDALEDAILEHPSVAQLARLQDLKRILLALRRVVAPQRDLFARAIEDLNAIPGLEGGDRDYFRDVHDHLMRISELVDSYRDLLSSAMDVYLSVTSNRLNVVMKRLTVVATIFLPLTFVTGFFGQNFGWMVDHIDSLGAFVVLGIGGSLVAGLGIWVWIRRRAEEPSLADPGSERAGTTAPARAADSATPTPTPEPGALGGPR